MEFVDLSHLRGIPKRAIKKEIPLGKKRAVLEVSITQSHRFGWNTWGISVTTVRGCRYVCQGLYLLDQVPASLPRDDLFRWVGGNRFGVGPYHRWVRFKTTDAFLLRLTEAYEEIVAEVSGVVHHEDLHTDTSNSEYDY